MFRAKKYFHCELVPQSHRAPFCCLSLQALAAVTGGHRPQRPTLGNDTGAGEVRHVSAADFRDEDRCTMNNLFGDLPKGFRSGPCLQVAVPTVKALHGPQTASADVDLRFEIE